jgi:trimeric autotransporter adhesin
VNGCTGATSCSSTFTTGADNGVVGTNAGSRADMVIDPVTNKPQIALYSTSTPNTQILHITAPSACNVAQTSTAAGWGAFNAVDATASAGLNGLKITMRNTANLFISYILATASVRQTKSSNGGTAWFATGHIIETPATAFGAHGVGSAYDSTNDVLYVSYATGGAANAVGNDIRVAFADPDDLQSAGAAGAAHAIDTIDQTSNSFPAPLASAPPLLSAARAANGTVGYAYYFHDNGGTFVDSKLYYGIRGGTATSPVFINRFVTNHQESSTATAAVGLSPSLAYDSNSRPVIAFYNSNTTEVSLNVARSGNGGPNFAVSVVDDTSADIGRFPSVGMYGSAIGIAYRDETNTALKFARWTPTGQWKRFFVDGFSGAGGTGCAVGNASGQYAKMAVTSTGRPVIVYQDDTGATSLLRIAIAAEAINNSAGTFTWTCLTLDSGSASATGFGEGIAIALDSSDKPHIVHFNFATGDYRYLSSTSAVGTAVSTGASAFTASIITNVTTPSLAAGNSIPSIQVNSSGTVYVALHDVQNRALVLGTKTSSASTFTLEQVEQAPNLGGITTPYAGQFPILLLNASNLPMIFYRSWENWIRYFSRE